MKLVSKLKNPSIVAAFAYLIGCSTNPDSSEAPPFRELPQVVDSGTDADAGDSHAPDGGRADDSGTCKELSSSYDAIQELIFERHGCTADKCHGEAMMGGLDLRADVSYENIVDAQSSIDRNARIQPGTANQSFLYQKLLAAARPDSIELAGSPMPVGSAPLNEDELTALEVWIQQGAPKTGTVVNSKSGIEVGKLLGACLPAKTTPTKIKPLDPPPPEEGIQLRLPAYLLKAGSEVEHCTPFVYDFTDRVPDAFKDKERNVMFVNSSRVRQDPQSHHLVVWNPHIDPTTTEQEGKWTCRGGQRDAESCNPKLVSRDCDGGGVCAGETVPGSFCGDTRRKGESGGSPGSLVNAQSPQEYVPALDGVYWEIPMRGVAGFNSHSFNLDTEDTLLEARVNYYYAAKRERELRQRGSADKISVADGQPPFTRKTYCGKHVVPQNYSLVVMTGHTHRRGERFWVNDPSGEMIYESLIYSDPLYKRYDPWVEFSSSDEASRTLEYCATFNNGLTKRDTPDIELVTRASRMPERTSCTPVACVSGKIAAACTHDGDCDTTEGAGDGSCDACPITAGPTTENEMFVLTPWYVLPSE